MQISVKKGDPPLELPTIKIPGTVSEAWQQITNFGKSNSVTDKEQQKDEVIDDVCPLECPVNPAASNNDELADELVPVVNAN